MLPRMWRTCALTHERRFGSPFPLEHVVLRSSIAGFTYDATPQMVRDGPLRLPNMRTVELHISANIEHDGQIVIPDYMFDSYSYNWLKSDDEYAPCDGAAIRAELQTCGDGDGDDRAKHVSAECVLDVIKRAYHDATDVTVDRESGMIRITYQKGT